MKKTYINPKTKIVKLSINAGLLTAISGTTVSGTNGGWTKEENPSESENIWGDQDW